MNSLSLSIPGHTTDKGATSMQTNPAVRLGLNWRLTASSSMSCPSRTRHPRAEHSMLITVGYGDPARGQARELWRHWQAYDFELEIPSPDSQIPLRHWDDSTRIIIKMPVSLRLPVCAFKFWIHCPGEPRTSKLNLNFPIILSKSLKYNISWIPTSYSDYYYRWISSKYEI